MSNQNEPKLLSRGYLHTIEEFINIFDKCIISVIFFLKELSTPIVQPKQQQTNRGISLVLKQHSCRKSIHHQ